MHQANIISLSHIGKDPTNYRREELGIGKKKSEKKIYDRPLPAFAQGGRASSGGERGLMAMGGDASELKNQRKKERQEEPLSPIVGIDRQRTSTRDRRHQ